MGKLNLKQNELKGAFTFFLNANNALENYNAELIMQNKDEAQRYFKMLIKNMVKKTRVHSNVLISLGRIKKRR